MFSIDLGEWDGFLYQIRHHMATKDISTFMSWSIIQGTMISGIDEVEVQHLKKNWSYWEDKVIETRLKPNSHYLISKSSTNNLHHAYSLQILMDNLGIQLSNLKMITEFGGGYGNTARLVKMCGFNGEYTIYDIPELSEIQKYYLHNNNIENIHFLNFPESITDVSNESLFLALWSLTETPVYSREVYIDSLKFMKHDYVFMAMGEQFHNENNMMWLKNEIIPLMEKNSYECKIIKIEHGNGMYYFAAKKIKK
jgi:hypothetical protein